MFILKTGHQPGVYVPLRALFLVSIGFKSIYEHLRQTLLAPMSYNEFSKSIVHLKLIGFPVTFLFLIHLFVIHLNMPGGSVTILKFQALKIETDF